MYCKSIGIIGFIILQLVCGGGDEGENYSPFQRRMLGNPIETDRKALIIGGNPEESGPYLEGDLLIPMKRKNAISAPEAKWEGGLVPYTIEDGFTNSDLQVLQRVMKRFHHKTCIRFVPRTDEEDYLVFGTSSTGCWSSIGKLGGPQDLNLESPLCFRKVGTAQHEILHALGFIHEHNRYDRDDFVDIVWNNIVDGHEHNFVKLQESALKTYGVGYDYASLLHYSEQAFTRNGKPTIIPKDSRMFQYIGQRLHFSRLDVAKINRMYNCTKYM